MLLLCALCWVLCARCMHVVAAAAAAQWWIFECMVVLSGEALT